ncbi:hypothetical protein [Streptomyces sp. NPDC051994]|uniref:hypothetical protein n=1 Tax=unclassified Streptomyces TaxID=2593676 RepID=UPI00343725AD
MRSTTPPCVLEQGHVSVRDMVTRQLGPTDGPDYPMCDAVSRHALRSAPGVTPAVLAS